MAKNQQGTTFVAVPDDELETFEASERSDEERSFEEFRNSLEAGKDMPTVRVYRVPQNSTGSPMNAKLIYCFAFPVDRYSYEELCEYVRETYGGGLYRLIGTKPGKKGSAFNSLLEIAKAETRRNQNDGAPKSSDPATLMDTVANMLNAQQQRTEEMLARLGATNRGTDPMAAMQASMALFTQMLGAMAPIIGARAAPAGGDILSELEKLAKIQDLLGGFGGGGGGGREAETNFYDLASQALKAGAPLLAAVASRGGLPPPAPVARPAIEGHATQVPPEARPNPTPSPQAAQNMEVKKQIDQLVMMAQSGTGAEQVADMILNYTPDEKVPALRAFLSRPDLVEYMATMNPAVTSHRTFFDSLKSLLLAALAAEEAAAAEADPATP